jgi:hypothetical protein
MGLDDYITDIDAHAENNTPVFHLSRRKFLDAGLELHRSSNLLDSARKLGQEPVARALDNAASVLRDCRLDGVL